MPRRIRGPQKRRRTFLREWRKHRGLSLERASSRFDMSVAQLSRVETGESPYTQDFLELASDAYGTDIPSLLMRDPSDGLGIWSLWDQAKPAEQRQIEDVVRALVKKRA